MKKLCTFLLLSLLSVVSAFAGTELRVMTYNMRLEIAVDGEHQWKYRKDFAADLVRFHQPDIWGSQEVTHPQLVDLLDRLPEYDYIGVGRDDGKEKGEYSPIFYRKDRFDLEKSGYFWLAEEAKMHVPGALGWDADYPRVATWGIFKDKVSGERFFMLNTHLDHVGVEARRNGAKLVLSEVSRLSENLPVIVTGDFNAVPTDEPIRILTDKTNKDAFTHTRDVADFCYGPDWTFHAYGTIDYDQRTFIDYVFFKGNFKVKTHAVITDTKGKAYPSDHCPVLAIVELKK